ncbi:MAG: T9SS type A sorting domain-containing protein [Candidatus Kapabacteria bacterium]|nr:T9SS type A sorting domain-containing protein [Candidatus Kapabacteria bacterium]
MRTIRVSLLAICVIVYPLYPQVWKDANNGLTKEFVQSLYVNGASIYACTYGDGVFLSNDSGASWKTVNTGLTGRGLYIHNILVTSEGIYAGTDGVGVWKSTDNAASWKAMNNGIEDKVVRIIVANGYSVYAGTTSGVFISTDKGISWKGINNGLKSLHVNALLVNSFGIYAGTSNGLFVSTNNGSTWTEVGNGLKSKYVTALAVNQTGIFAGTVDSGVFLSTNDGLTWDAINNGIAGLGNNVRTFAVNKSSVHTGTLGNGVYSWSDNGNIWTVMNNGLSSLSVYSLVAMESLVFVATQGDGVFKMNITPTSVDIHSDNKQLILCSPNPSNGEVQIQYPLNNSENSKLYVTDIHGRKLIEVPTSTENTIINTKDWAEGVYMVVLHTPSNTFTEKLVVVR